MAEKSKFKKKKHVEIKVDAIKKIDSETAEKKKDVKKKKNDEKSISDIIKAKKVDEKKSIDNKVAGQKRVKSLFSDAGYMRHLLKQQENMLDYSKLFSHMGKKREVYNSYDTYSSAYGSDSGEVYTETISTEAVDRIIEDSIVENMCGFSLNRATIEEKEAFKVYAMFNRTLIQLKYAMGLG